MRLLVAGGGTGGHVFPGIAVADLFVQRAEAPRIIFAGAAGGMEERLVPAAGYSLFLLRSGGLKGKRSGERALALLRFPWSLIQGIRLILSFEPDVVLGVGGYAAAAVCLAARLFNITVVVQEQNAIPGVTNRLLGKFAQRIFLAFAGSEIYFPRGRCELTGNPIRHDILQVPPPKRLAADQPLTVLVFGGSQGAQAINRAVIAALPQLHDLKPGLRFIHQTGARDYSDVAAAYLQAGYDRAAADVRPFIDDMADAYRRADLVIARSGASILEIAACGRASILIPYPFAADNHQAANARIFEQQGAAMVIANSEFSGARCAELLRQLKHDPARLAQMSQAALALARRDAASRIADVCLEVAAANRKHRALGRAAATATRPGGDANV